MPTKEDFLLGRIAVERGLIDQAQLDQALKDLASAPGITLGTYLLDRKIIVRDKLDEAVQEQLRRLKTITWYEKMAKAELDFGQLLVKFNKATQIQVNKCLEIQQKMAEEGKSPIPRLGELLVEHGYVDAKTVQEILKLQSKDILVCSACGKQVNVIGIEQGKAYRCRTCGGTMMTKSMLANLRADETTYGFELSGDEPPSI